MAADRTSSSVEQPRVVLLHFLSKKHHVMSWAYYEGFLYTTKGIIIRKCVTSLCWMWFMRLGSAAVSCCKNDPPPPVCPGGCPVPPGGAAVAPMGDNLDGIILGGGGGGGTDKLVEE